MARKVGKTNANPRDTSHLAVRDKSKKPDPAGRNKGMIGVDRSRLDLIEMERRLKAQMREIWDDETI